MSAQYQIHTPTEEKFKDTINILLKHGFVFSNLRLKSFEGKNGVTYNFGVYDYISLGTDRECSKVLHGNSSRRPDRKLITIEEALKLDY